MINKIIVALDGSKPAEKALDFALDLAKKYHAEILLLSVFQPPTIIYSFPEALPIPEQNLKKLKERYEKILIDAKEKAKKFDSNINTITKLEEGRPSDKIVDCAKKEDIDIIVMGSRGLGGIKEFFLGSVSHRVAEEATCPVLIIK